MEGVNTSSKAGLGSVHCGVESREKAHFKRRVGMKNGGSMCVGGLILVLAISACAGAPEPAEPSNAGAEQGTTIDPVELVGAWEGTLKAGSTEVRIVFRIATDPEGNLNAVLDSPDEGVTGIPVSSIEVTGDQVRLVVSSAGAVYAGTFLEQPRTIEGSWQQSGMSFPLTLHVQEKPVGLSRPQTPTPPFPYSESAVEFRNEEAGVTLAATLTLPSGDGPYPAVVLVSGSGPQNRDEEIFGHRPFLVLADRLTRSGIAVLRYDDRGVGDSTGDFGSATSVDFAADAEAGIRFLARHTAIDPERIGVLGHSEGGLIATMLAPGLRNLAFIVLMAGPGLPGDEILLLQSGAILRASGADEQTIEWARDLNSRIYDIVKNQPEERAAEQIGEILRDAGLKEDQIEAQIGQLLGPWYRYFLTFDPRPLLRQISCPVLAVIGEKDLQVPPSENLAAIGQALAEGGNEDFTVRELPGLNHLLQPAETGLVGEYGQIDVTIDPDALDLIVGWISERVVQ